MSLRQYVCELTIASALAGCARSIEEYGGAPLPENAELSINQRVTVVGRIDEVRGEQTFTITNTNLTGIDERLLVIAERPAREITMGGAIVFRGEWVSVYGMVRRLSVPDVERAYGFDLDHDLAVTYDNRPVIVTRWISEPAESGGAAARRSRR
jgi:hypothetical protein